MCKSAAYVPLSAEDSESVSNVAVGKQVQKNFTHDKL